MADQSCILGIDIGTTSVKTIVFAKSGLLLAQSVAQLTLISNEEAEGEQDPYEMYEKITGVMVDVLKNVVEQGYYVQSVGFSAAMHSIMPVSAVNQPLGHALTWLDGRAFREANAIWKTEEGRKLYRQTGTPVHAMSPMVKLVWMRNNMPEIFYATSKFVSLKEWVWYQWFGVWEVDQSMASASGMFNIATRQWDHDALRLVQIDADQLSNVVSTESVRQGCMDSRLLEAGITATTRFNIGASDGVLASLGIGAVKNGVMALTMGTSIAVRMLSDVVQTHDEIRSFCYILDDHRYIIGAPSNSGGIMLGWVYRNLVKDLPSIEDAITAAEVVDLENLYCLPYISGERAPLWNSESRASFVGLSHQHSSAHMMRAAIEGVLFNAYWISAELFTKVGTPTLLIVSGKLFAVTWVLQLLADIFDIPVQADFVADAAIQGAVYLATSTNSPCQHEEAIYPRQHDKYTLKFQEFRRLASLLNL
ncbi:MAG: gluconokinase [Bacilli bacterium]